MLRASNGTKTPPNSSIKFVNVENSSLVSFQTVPYFHSALKQTNLVREQIKLDFAHTS